MNGLNLADIQDAKIGLTQVEQIRLGLANNTSILIWPHKNDMFTNRVNLTLQDETTSKIVFTTTNNQIKDMSPVTADPYYGDIQVNLSLQFKGLRSFSVKVIKANGNEYTGGNIYLGTTDTPPTGQTSVYIEDTYMTAGHPYITYTDGSIPSGSWFDGTYSQSKYTYTIPTSESNTNLRLILNVYLINHSGQAMNQMTYKFLENTLRFEITNLTTAN